MAIGGNSSKTYVGVISSIPASGKDNYEVRVDIPSIGVKGAKAVPDSSSVIDEPQVGNVVQLSQMNPTINSTYTYKVFKNSSHSGIRSRGNNFTMTEEGVTLGISTGWKQWTQDADLPCDAYITFDKSGGITIASVNPELQGKIKIIGNADVELFTNGCININGNSNINVIGKGDVNIFSSDSNINISSEGTCSISSNSDVDIVAKKNINLTADNIDITGNSISISSGIVDVSETNIVSSKALPTKTVPTTIPVLKI